MTQQEIDLYKEVYDSMYAGIEQLKPGNTTADVASKFPEYDDDTYGTVTLQQFAHSIGLTLYEGMWMSRAYSLKYPAEIKEICTSRSRRSPGTQPCGRRRAWKRTCWFRRKARGLHADGAHGRDRMQMAADARYLRRLSANESPARALRKRRS